MTINKRYVKSLKAAVEKHKKAVAKHRDELRDFFDENTEAVECEGMCGI